MQDLFPEKLIKPRTAAVQGGSGSGSVYQPALAPPPKITIEKKDCSGFGGFPGHALRGISPSSGRKFPRLAREGF
jgi:hypothetical protein